MNQTFSIKARLLAEAFGTFCLVFIGTGAIVINDYFDGMIGHVGIALSFGLVVLTMIFAVGNVSGAHINPAVTLGFFLAGRFERVWLAPYIISQLAGAVLASLVLMLLFPGHLTLGATLPAGSFHQTFVIEVIITLILMFVILTVATGSRERGLIAGSAVGSVVAMAALVAGPVTGASMNPARSLAPALFSLELHSLWIYLVAPLLGAALAVYLFNQIFEEN